MQEGGKLDYGKSIPVINDNRQETCYQKMEYRCGKCKKEKDYYLRTLLFDDDNKYHVFCCPNKECEAPVMIGTKRCKWCCQRLKWEYPFDIEDTYKTT